VAGEALPPAILGTDFSDVDPVFSRQGGEAGKIADEERSRTIMETTTLLLERKTLKFAREI
jgi:hypothetical protein